MENELEIGTYYTYSENFEYPIDFPWSGTETLTLGGKVVYNDGTNAIVKIDYGNFELQLYVFYEEELKKYFPDFQNPEDVKGRCAVGEFLCLDIKSKKPSLTKVLDENGECVMWGMACFRKKTREFEGYYAEESLDTLPDDLETFISKRK